METIKTVGIKDLKNNLSAYLRDVKRGSRILVTDRDEVVAELREPFSLSPLERENPLLAEWVREGKVRLPTRPKRSLPPLPSLNISRETILKIIDEDRGE